MDYPWIIHRYLGNLDQPSVFFVVPYGLLPQKKGELALFIGIKSSKDKKITNTEMTRAAK